MVLVLAVLQVFDGGGDVVFNRMFQMSPLNCKY